MLIFNFYSSFQTALLSVLEFELHSNPRKLGGKVFIISCIQGIISKEGRPDRVSLDLATECRFTSPTLSAGIPPPDRGISHLTHPKAKGWG